MKEIIEILIGIGCVFLVGFLISSYSNMIRLKNLKKKIIEGYAQQIDIDEVDIKMNRVSSYYENKCNAKIIDNSNIVDDITWNDLNMDEVFKKINNTQSTVGQEKLYDMLRRSLYDDNLKNRDRIISYFKENESDRFKLQYILGKLGYSKEAYTSNCLFNEDFNGKNKLLKYKILSKLPIINLILVFFNKFFVLPMIGFACLNIYISLNERRKNYSTEGFTYLIKVINIARKIKSLNINVINENLDDISEDLKRVKKIRRKSIGSDPNSLISEINILSEYTNMLFLSELITYEKIKKTIIENKDYLINIYEFVGSIDALIAVASFRDSLDYFTKPVLNESINKGEKHLMFKEMYHPLIKNPVANSGSFDKSALITGSNASGKSTFIKTIAINAILAQSIYTCCAKEYLSSYFKIYTSMALKDSVLSNESYYIVEIKSLKRILDNVDDRIPSLCFVDEILRGTNTVERIASSSEVLKTLSEDNCICFAATHDIELTYLLENRFNNYHFEENITDNDIRFDYKLYKGRAESRNAIKLLSFMGYSDNIVKRAQERAEKFVCTGKWQ